MPLPLTSRFEDCEDAALLQRYAHAAAEDAFAELVRRRIGLVYSVALRQLGGDRHRAEDATQIVFNDLARKARTLCDRPVLAGWLYRSARLAAAELVRAEQRRQRREQEADTMEKLLNETARDEDWRQVRPVLDEALSEIEERDRDAIVLRFFDGRAFAEIGVQLRLSENAARMRVQRALDQLNAALARRGVRSTAGALSLALANQIGATAPVGMAASVAGAAVAQGSAAASGWAATFAATKFAIAAASGVAAVGAAGYVWQQKANAALQAELSSLQRQQQSIAVLRTENERLAATAAEVAALRRDDVEFKQLAQQVDEARKANEEKMRLARAQAATRANNQNTQAEIERMNREGNALVTQYKALNAVANDSAQTPDERAKAAAAAKLKMAEIWAKQREVQALIAAARAADPQFAPPKAELKKAESVPGEISARYSFRSAADAAVGGPAADTDRISLRLPHADLATALSALEHTTGLKVIRDPSLAGVRGTVDFQTEKVTRRDAMSGLGQALRDQLNVILEPRGEGTVVAKLSGP